jgi:phosphate transport system permease protein
MKPRIGDWIMERTIAACAAAVALLVVGILFFLAWESRDSLNRKFAYGYRFALQPVGVQADPDVSADFNNSLLAAHPEGSEGLDENEERFPMPAVADLQGVAQLATGTALTGDISKVQPEQLYKDDWRASKTAGHGDRFLLFAFATPEYRLAGMRLVWQPDNDFDSATVPYRVRLRSLRVPDGAKPVDVDLSAMPKGSIEVPTWIAKTDADRTKGYVFQMVAEPTVSNGALASIAGLFHSDWNPTAAYGRFGVMPLLYGTLAITMLALLIAVPLGVWTALFLSEIAPPRLREWLKPVIELLASVPTVVLGYFGLMLVAPGLVQVFKSAVQMESGRCLATAAIMMAVLILPTVTSIAEDALRSVPSALREGADALGMAPAESIRRVVLPAAKGGIVGAALLGMARAIGETMIVWILAGGSATLPSLSKGAQALVQPVRGIPDTIAVEMGNVEFAGPHYGHLFLLGLLLFVFTIVINLAGHAYARRHRWQA